MKVLNETIATLRRIQAQTGALPSAHFLDVYEFKRLVDEIDPKHTPIGGLKILDVLVRPYDLLPPT